MDQCNIIDSGNIGFYIAACAAEQNIAVAGCFGEPFSSIEVKSPLGDFVVSNVQSEVDLKQLPVCDFLFLNINTIHDLCFDLMSLDRIVSADGVVVIFQKGVSYYEELISALPGRLLLGGLCWLKPTKLSASLLKHDFGRLIQLGSYAPLVGNSAALPLKLQSLFDKSRLDFEFVNDYWGQAWTRFVFNIPLFVLSVLNDQSSQALLTTPIYQDQIAEIRREIASVPASLDICVDESKIFEMDKTLAASSISYPGFKQDYDAGRALHLDDLFQGFFDQAERINIATPLTDNLYKQVCKISKAQ